MTLPPPELPPRTDFGRETFGGHGVPSLSSTLRERAEAIARADRRRWHLAMGAIGLVGGLALTVPTAIWLGGKAAGGGQPARIVSGPAVLGERFSSQAVPALVSAPQLTAREGAETRAATARGVEVARAVPQASVASPPAGAATTPVVAVDESGRLFEAARQHMRKGDIEAARRVLGNARIAERGEALFMLAETWDPNVLAAMAVHGVLAEPAKARSLYEAARAKGIAAAAKRIEALE
jgi:hypothetical protein